MTMAAIHPSEPPVIETDLPAMKSDPRLGLMMLLLLVSGLLAIVAPGNGWAQDGDDGFDIFEEEEGTKPDADGESDESDDGFDMFEEEEGPKPDSGTDTNGGSDDGFDMFEGGPGSNGSNGSSTTGDGDGSSTADDEKPAGFFGDRFTFVHNLRAIVGLIDNYSFDPFFNGNNNDGLANLSYRLGFEDRPDEVFGYKLHIEQRIFTTSAPSVSGAGALTPGGVGDTRYRALDAYWNQVEETDLATSLLVDWLFVTLSFRAGDMPIDLHLGRQAISFTSSYIYSPLDEFLPYDPRQIDQTYKPGVDAARLDFTLDSTTGLTIVAVAGRTIQGDGTYGNSRSFDATWYGSAIVGRFFATVEGWQIALQGGKVYGGWQAGGALVGEIDPLQVYTEVAYFFADSGSPTLAAPSTGPIARHHLEAVVGINWYIDGEWQATFEYLFTGIADPVDPTASISRVGLGWGYSISRHIIAAMVNFTPDGEHSFSLLTAVSLSQNPSVQFQPALNLTISDDVSLIAGFQINVGDRPTVADGIRSEFGTFSNLGFVQIEINF